MVLTLFTEEYPMLCYIVGSDGRLLHILRSTRRPKKCVYWEHQRGINPARCRVPGLVGCGDNGRRQNEWEGIGVGGTGVCMYSGGEEGSRWDVCSMHVPNHDSKWAI